MFHVSESRLITACHVIVAAAAVLTVAAAARPWFLATLTPDMGGEVQAPDGPASGLYAHPSLWVAVGVAAAQLALLTGHYSPGGRLRIPGDFALLALGSGLACLIVAADFLLIPGRWADVLSHNGTWSVPFPWEGRPYSLDGCTLLMTWSYGAVVSITASAVSLCASVASLVARGRAPGAQASVFAPPS